MLAGTDSEKIVESAGRMLVKSRDWKNPFGDGKTAERIANVTEMGSEQR